MAESMSGMKRSEYCGLLREKHIDQTMTVMGWVARRRDLGGVIFIDLRDRTGILQVVFDATDVNEEDFIKAEKLRSEFVIAVEGIIELRDEETINNNIETGTIELRAKSLRILSEADTPPFQIDEHSKVNEEVRLKYRYLDLRRKEMQEKLMIRSKAAKSVREFFDGEGFYDFETPILTKSTPEGARDYLVPSRIHPGNFYALPQSPQIFKQLLMVSGFDKYYQIAKCFRDEDLRADRQPEFTQIDVEMSFVEPEDVISVIERLLQKMFKDVLNMDITLPFEQLTYKDAMDRFGSDKPDMRFDMEIIELTHIAKDCAFKVFADVVKKGGNVRGLNAKGCGNFTRTQIEDLTENALSYGAKGMAWIVINEDGSYKSVITKFFKEEEVEQIIETLEGKPGDLLIFCADKLDVICNTLGNLRLDIADILGLRKKDEFKFVTVTEFPMFEYSKEQKRFVAQHHPFTMPVEEDIDIMDTEPEKVRTKAYDIVLNGVELGSGSIRIHRRDVQEKVFNALGFSKEEAEERFGFLLNAFKYGTPPHGGFACGLDRIVMLMVGSDSIRDVIAFPKIRDASCMMTEAPGQVEEKQLEELSIKLDLFE